MASTIGAWSYVKNDGSLSTKDDVNSNLSSTGKNKSTTNKTTLDVEQFLQLMVAEMQNQESAKNLQIIRIIWHSLLHLHRLKLLKK